MNTVQNYLAISLKRLPQHKDIKILEGIKLIPFLSIFLAAAIVWNIEVPQGISIEAWHLLIIFISTIASIICNILPMGAVTLLAMMACVITHTLSLQACLKSFSDEVVWLVIFAFFIAKGFIKSGFGARLAYLFIISLGKTSLGLAYGLVFADFFLASAIPSNTARGIGIIFPILKSLAGEYESCPQKGTQRKIGAFLFKVCYQANVISSAMFMTALAGNSLAAKLALDLGIEITWKSWALGALIPGAVNLLLIPLLLYYFYPPELKLTPKAPALAKSKLKEAGPLNISEVIVLITFVLLLGLWIFGNSFGISSAATALIGCVILLCTGVLHWEEVLEEKNAWATLIWFGVLVTMAGALGELGFINWLGNRIQSFSFSCSLIVVLPILILTYYYSHYLFASATAHIIALYPTFLVTALSLHVPPLLAAFLFAMLSNLSAGLTHYGNGSAPVYYGAGFVTMRDWWYLGSIASILNLIIWLFIGSLWWKVIGFW